MSGNGHSERSRSTDEKRRRLIALLDEQGEGGAVTLSVQQEREWFLTQLSAGTRANHVGAALALDGPLDVARLQHALSEVLRRHESLRSRFLDVDGRPVRLVVPSLALPVRTVDLSDIASEGRDDELRSRLAEHWSEPFDLTSGPLVRVTLYRLGENEHVLSLASHRIACDRTSLDTAIADLAAAYAALADGGGPASPEPTRSYSDFVATQREWLQGEEAGSLTEDWRGALAGLEPLNISTDRPRPPVQTFRGDVVRRSLPATSPNALLAAFCVVLARYSGQYEFAVGTPVTDGEPDRPLGPRERVAVVRADLTGRPSFRELLDRVERAAADARERAELPFEVAVERLRPERDLSRSPLFQVAFEAGDALPAIELPGLTMRRLDIHPGTAAYDLTLSATPAGDATSAALEFNADLFDRSTAERMLGHLETLVEAAAADPEMPVAELPLLRRDEDRELAKWSRGPSAPAPAATLHERLAAQVERTPGAPAVADGDERLIYAELDERANRLAHRLGELGVGPEARVAVCMERSGDLIVALLAVLKAGGAYVPLDPGYPTERLEFMVEDANARLVLCQERLVSALPKNGCELLAIDSEWEEIQRRPADPPPSLVTPGNLAYVIYTSGSTGRPKGVGVTHAAVANYLDWAVRTYEVDRGEGTLLHSPIGFDLTVTGTFAPLLAGRTVSVVADDPGIGTLAAALRDARGQSFVKLTPAHLELLAHTLDAADAHGATYFLVVGGEALFGETVRSWREAAPDTRIVNEYGPTEAAVGCCVHEVPLGTEIPLGPVAIGRPIANTTLRVLDEEMRLVPVGVPGELYIGGAGLARGYLGRPGLTAERFVPDPLGEPGRRLYRTGDVVRYRPDGELEFLGRTDHQVKVRGHRIELGEIESTLASHPGVREAVVLAREDVPGDSRLVAYVVGDGDTPPSRDELHRCAERVLPDYMVPSAFVRLDALPLTSNGKVDRRALPVPDRERPDLGGAYVAPRTALEEELTEKFAGVLGVDRVGVHDDFFALGGHSLLVARLFARLVREYQIDIHVDYFFVVPTVAGMARLIDVYRSDGREAAIAALDQTDLEAEAVLDPTVAPGSLPHASYLEPKRIFITGATGFLGSFILEDLLRRTDAEAWCLVRADSKEQGLARIEATLRKYEIWHDGLAERIHPVLGDLAAPGLGVDPAEMTELTGLIDSIYHSGAQVNFVYPYSALRAANVKGTEEILRLATTTRVKAVHYFSAVDVFVSGDYGDKTMREEEAPLGHGVPHGYVQSKWVGERLVLAARDRGVPVCVFRPWIVMGHSQTGACHTSDFLYLALKGCIQVGMAPDIDMAINVVPVDFVTETIAHISLQESSFGRIFHIPNPRPTQVSHVYEWVRSMGYELEEVSWSVWRQRALEADSDNALYTIAPLLREEGLYPEELQPRIDWTNARQGIEGTGIECAPVDRDLIETYVHRLVETGFLPAPQTTAAAVPVEAE